MSPIEALRDGIEDLLKPNGIIRELDHRDGVRKSHTVYVQRYAYAPDRGIGHQADLSTMQHLWVHRDAVCLDTLGDIEHEVRPGYKEGEPPGRNSNLEQIPGFRFAALIRFTPKTVGEAERIIRAAVGDEGAA